MQLDRIRTRCFGRFDDRDGLIKVLIVVGRHFGNDVSGVTRTDSASVDGDMVHEVCSLGMDGGRRTALISRVGLVTCPRLGD